MLIAMPAPTLIVITGFPCTGKTTMGRRLGEDLDIPFFYKDAFKEKMYDAMLNRGGEQSLTLAMSRKLGGFSIDCLSIVAHELISKGRSLIIEANFDADLFSPVLTDLKASFPVQVIQVSLTAEGPTLVDRFVRREAGERHPGHQGMKDLEQVKSALLGRDKGPMRVEGELIRIDTTDFEAIAYSELRDKIKASLERK
jgi:predicted kinase